jgi:hypothetical protein
MTEDQYDERRQFNAECTLHQNSMEWPTEVLDISLKGILVRKPDHFAADLKSPLEATVKLTGSDSYIVMSLEYAHLRDNSLGLRCKYIDLDSMTHLKRLVELNLGDEAMLKRELDSLTTH